MIDRDQKKSRWPIVVAVVVLALLASGLLTFLAVRKVAVEERVEEKFWTDETMAKPTPKWAPMEPQENEGN